MAMSVEYQVLLFVFSQVIIPWLPVLKLSWPTQILRPKFLGTNSPILGGSLTLGNYLTLGSFSKIRQFPPNLRQFYLHK